MKKEKKLHIVNISGARGRRCVKRSVNLPSAGTEERPECVYMQSRGASDLNV
jgi:hypothetical protein